MAEGGLLRSPEAPKVFGDKRKKYKIILFLQFPHGIFTLHLRKQSTLTVFGKQKML
jgi:hypothetical protein